MPDKKTFLPEQAEIDAVIGEFNGDTDALAALTRMAEALLSYRHWLRQLVDGVEMVQQRRRNTKGRAMRKLRSILLTAMFLAVATPALAGDFPREFVGRWCEV
jgi:hypothetical protein